MSELSPYNNDSGHIEISTFPLCKKTAQFINDSGIQCIRHFDLEAEQNCVNSEFNYFKNAYVTNHKQIERLNQQLREKEARIGRLEGCIYRLTNRTGLAEYVYDSCEEALNETPKQSLAHIQAEAVEKAIKDLDMTAFVVIGRGPVISESSLYRYANQLRQQADKQ